MEFKKFMVILVNKIIMCVLEKFEHTCFYLHLPKTLTSLDSSYVISVATFHSDTADLKYFTLESKASDRNH